MFATKDSFFHQERLIEIQKNKFTLDNLVSQIKAELSTTTLSPTLINLIKTFCKTRLIKRI